MPTVFILGAGASAAPGAPTMRAFVDRAAEVMYAVQGEDRQAFDDVFFAIAQLSPVFAKAHIDIDNIESIMGAIDMGSLLRKFGDRNAADIAKLRQSIRTV